MRYLRKQVLNRRAPYDQRLQVDVNDNILMSSPAAVQVPAGSTIQRPIVGNRYGTTSTGDLSGMIRYNTQTNQLEGYQAGNWRAFRFKESTQITQQSLGAGDDNNLYFGPLSPAPPTTVESTTTWGGQNLLVIVENVIQLATTNYTIVQNPSVPSESYTGTLSYQAEIDDNTLYFNTSLLATSATGDGTTATITFPTQTQIPFSVGSTITVTGFKATGFNGVQTVTASTTSSVSYLNSTNDTSTVSGVITSNNSVFTAVDLVGAVVSGSASVQSSTTVVSYVSDPTTDALISVVISKPLITSNIPINTAITLTEPTYSGSGYFLKFSSPVPYGKTVTVLHGFDK